MIEVQSLTMHYGNFVALDKVSFQARDHEILGLLGPNGAGKTTAMRLLTTYLHPTAGSAKIEGFDILQHPIDVRKHIGYLPETAPLYSDMQVEEYLKFVGEARGLSGDNLEKRLKWVREACDIDFIWKHTVSEISKGYKQRVGLAQALIHDPRVIILDEPTSGLDPIQIIGIRGLIKELAKTKTILFSTHILQEASAISDRLFVLNQGRLVAQGTLAELKSAYGKKTEESLEDVFLTIFRKSVRRSDEGS